jgi:hypothetical protein
LLARVPARRALRHREQRIRQARAGAARQHCRAELTGQNAGADLAHATQRVTQTFTGSQAQRKELQHGRKLLLDARDPLARRSRQAVVAAENSGRGEQRRQHGERRPATPEKGQCDDEKSTRSEPTHSPSELPGTKGHDVLTPPRLTQATRDTSSSSECHPGGGQAVSQKPPRRRHRRGRERVMPSGSAMSRRYGATRRESEGAAHRGVVRRPAAIPCRARHRGRRRMQRG